MRERERDSEDGGDKTALWQTDDVVRIMRWKFEEKGN